MIHHRSICLKIFVLTFAVFSAIAILIPPKTSASVGLFELRSTTSDDYRCFASSLLMSDKTYDIAVNCTNLIYPPLPGNIAYYIMWATPLTGKNILKLGDLGKGEARFGSRDPFTSLFVTIETNAGSRTPSKNIIMNGGVQPITFLQRPTTPTPTPVITITGTPQGNAILSTKDKLLLALQRAGIAAVIALVAIVGLIFVVSRSRG